MAAADAFVGEGLADSPYTEAMALCRERLGVIIDQQTEIEKWRALARERGVQVLEAKREAITWKSKCETQEEFTRLLKIAFDALLQTQQAAEQQPFRPIRG